MKILVTGGAGYIGSTICSALEEKGHSPIVLDSLVTGQEAFVQGRTFFKGDIADRAIIDEIFNKHKDIFCTIHCAARVVVPESVADPYLYYKENVEKSNELFINLIRNNSRRVVFSSSASIYDVVPGFMVQEDSPLKPQSPYAKTKFMMELILQDFVHAYGMSAIALRYFNPIGADPKMRSGMHARHPSHLLGKLIAVALRQEEEFAITGTQWPTRDGSGIRDYIHVWDLAQAHVNAMEQFDNIFQDLPSPERYQVINLGTGNGVTVKEFVTAFEKVFAKTVQKREAGPRPGDVAGAFANADRAKALLGWQTQLSIEQGIRDALLWSEKRKSILNY